jgi:hypothetical protein
MFELARRARWQDILDLLQSGRPPIYYQLLIANALIVAYVLLKGFFTARNMKNEKTSYRMEMIVILVNAAILFEPNWMPYVNGPVINAYVRNLFTL